MKKNTFNVTMDPAVNISAAATCTSCTFSEDFSNYWTAVVYFRARNGTFKRVPLMGNVGFEQATGGMTVYYSVNQKVTAFKPVSQLRKGRGKKECFGRAYLRLIASGFPHARWKPRHSHP